MHSSHSLIPSCGFFLPSVGKPLHYLLVDLAYPGKSTTLILQGLQSAYPFPQNEQERNAHKLFGETNLDIVKRAIEALKVGDAKKLGELMWEAQEEFDEVRIMDI